MIASGIQGLDQLTVFLRELRTSYAVVTVASEDRSHERQRVVRGVLASAACELLVHVTLVTSRLKPRRHVDWRCQELRSSLLALAW